jgi:dipeptidyl aminopeptidase/acylaminoacyl peptidase
MSLRPILAPALVLAALATPAVAAAEDLYQQPPAPIARILDAPPPPLVTLSPDRTLLLLQEREALPPVAEVAAPELRLAGLRIDPRTNGPSRASFGKGLLVKSLDGRPERRLETPPGARLASVRWSPDSSHVAFVVAGDDGLALWVAEVSTGRSRPLTPARLNAAAGSPCSWVGTGQALLCRLVPVGRGSAPAPPPTPRGPVLQESAGRTAPNRTYQDLLQDPADEALLEHHLTSQVAVVSLAGEIRGTGAPGLHVASTPSPDGSHLFVETVHRPYSYVVPLERFPRRLELWDLSGRVVRQVADVPLQDEVGPGFDAVAKGPRDAAWRDDAPATLVWTEALDQGDPARPAEKRDRLLSLAAPFGGEPVRLMDLGYRARRLTWARGGLALVEERWWKTRRSRTWALETAAGSTPRLLFDRSYEDRYADPGSFVTVPGPSETRLLLTTRDGRSAFLAGTGASAEGDRPFLDRLDLATGRAVRLFRSEAPYHEEAIAPVDDAGRRLLTRRESAAEPPNYVLRDLVARRATPLTAFPDPAPELAGAQPQLLRYRRRDGVELTARLYLPPGYDRSKGPLPFLFWAYPVEFRSAAAAAQVQGSPHRFTRPSGASHLFALTQGYGVLDDPAMPIVGEAEKEPNDTYVEQLVMSAEAAVDKVVEMGVADRARIAVGGHSYGAFMTANLLAHSDLFRAGIARSGAYNRSLTPFGFQAEERTYWQARETYARMSPFDHADKIKEPILLIHGMADNNSGTFPIQSERFFAALQGHGATVRFVLLPAESHGYRGRESVGHVLWEMMRWLDRHVRSAPPRPAS